MTTVSPRRTRHPIGQFLSAAMNAAGGLALVLLTLAALLPEMQHARAPVLLGVALSVGVLQTTVLWAIKARLRSRWPAIDSLL